MSQAALQHRPVERRRDGNAEGRSGCSWLRVLGGSALRIVFHPERRLANQV